jgi:hypothetical protein
MRERVYDFVAAQFYTQAEIDALNESILDDYGTRIINNDDIPNDATSRRQVFLSVDDLAYYLDDGGIPASYVFILVIPNFDGAGNTAYKLFISTG